MHRYGSADFDGCSKPKREHCCQTRSEKLASYGPPGRGALPIPAKGKARVRSSHPKRHQARPEELSRVLKEDSERDKVVPCKSERQSCGRPLRRVSCRKAGIQWRQSADVLTMVCAVALIDQARPSVSRTLGLIAMQERRGLS